MDGKHRSHRLREASPGPAGLFPRRVTDSTREHTSAMPATIAIEGASPGRRPDAAAAVDPELPVVFDAQRGERAAPYASGVDVADV